MPPRPNLSVIFVVLLLIPLLVFAAEVSEDNLDRQMLEIAKDLRCAVCQNEPVSDSRSDLARDMRKIIREKLQAGESRQQIIQYFVDRYGNYILLKPPYDGTGAVLWALPLIVFTGAIFFAAFYLRKRKQAEQQSNRTLTAQQKARIAAVRKEYNQ